MLSTMVCHAQKAGTVLKDGAQEKNYFFAVAIPDSIFRRMQGRSYPKGCTVKRSDLRYLRLLHRNMSGATQVGEMVCHRSIATALVDIFRALYREGYRIERMVLIDEYEADDARSMAANNTSCFNFRYITGSTTRISRHGMGMAVDINPLYNPYVSRSGKVLPVSGKAYADRRCAGAMPKGSAATQRKAVDDLLIRRGDVCHRLFVQHGFRWGGAWKSQKDYQHFEK